MRVSLIAATCLALAGSAFADRNAPLEGDDQFLADAYRDADSGRDFSYAREWGARRAYDGTDTSRTFESTTPTQSVAPPVPAARDHLVLKSSRRGVSATTPRPKLRGRFSS